MFVFLRSEKQNISKEVSHVSDLSPQASAISLRELQFTVASLSKLHYWAEESEIWRSVLSEPNVGALVVEQVEPVRNQSDEETTRGRPTFVFNVQLQPHPYCLPACLISHLLPLLFNPPKESAKLQ
jgi:hypothetical protein